MRHFLPLLFFCTCWGAKAQTWSPSGATWHYSWYTIAPVSAYVKIEYSGDTLIGTDTWKKLERYHAGYDYISNNTFSQHDHTYYTREIDSVVYLYDTASASADTLYNFKAVIGQQWGIIPHYTGNCDSGYVKVLNTGVRTINGQNLKWLYLELDFTDDDMPVYNDTLYQKIGPRGFFGMNDVCSNALDANEGGPFRCYSDDVFGTYNVTGNVCDYTLAVNDPEINSQYLWFYPNPITGRELMIRNNLAENISFTLHDIQGKLLLTGMLPPGTHPVDIGDLEKGFYLLQMVEQGRAYPLVKE